MARDAKPGLPEHARGGVIEDAAGHFGDPPAVVATNVLVVLLVELVPGFAVAQLDPVDGAFALQGRDSPKNGRVVSAAESLADRFVELVEGPGVPPAGAEQLTNRVGDRARPWHSRDYTRRPIPFAQVICARMLRVHRTALTLLTLAVFATACGSTATGAGQATVLKVVAGQNFWGSIAAQLGGSKANIQSVVTDPNADPHSYESSSADARAFAEANLVILNGAGYDDWGQKLLDANPSSTRQVLNVAGVLGKKPGDNPHFWYNPDYVSTAADAITAKFKALDSADAAYFDQQRAAVATAFKPYLVKIAEIKQRFAGTPIGSTESIFVYMATALGLNLISPPEFMKAVAEGTDPPAETVAAFQSQVQGGQIKVLVFNKQTVTAVTTNIENMATANRIPVVGVTETMQPLTATFQDWQLTQLTQLESVL